MMLNVVVEDVQVHLFCKTAVSSAGRAKAPVKSSVLMALLVLMTLFLGSNAAAITTSLKPCLTGVVRVGDGNPHASCRRKQISGSLSCGGGSCSTTLGKSRKVHFDSGGTIGGRFATLGFNVSESFTVNTPYDYYCAGSRGQTICITALVTYTDYTAKESVISGDCTKADGAPYVIYAPNTDSPHLFQCQHGAACGGSDSEQWDHDGAAC
ncbi:hypothetical protein CBS101457_004929 [Exobasidium rhododendri]|nr:hypothetical protein CBS101457_004929 [Exobasidium rhododendri]